MAPLLSDRHFLITGGTGSFGQTMVTRLLAAGAATVRVLSRDEAKQETMRLRLRDDRVRLHVGDVRDFETVLKATRDVEYVFRAAALKQVPSCEFFPLEAVRTNVVGRASACTIGDLATAVCNLFGAPTKLDTLGIRHGEKMVETLATRQELARAEDCGDYFRVPIDSRGLNYAVYVDEGDLKNEHRDDYTSDNAPRLTVPEIMSLLLTLPEVRARLAEVAGLPGDDQIAADLPRETPDLVAAG